MPLKRCLDLFVSVCALLLPCLFVFVPGMPGMPGTIGHADAQVIRLKRPGPLAPDHVLVVQNSLSEDSKAIASYYVQKRKIPGANVCTISCSPAEECTLHEYESKIERFVMAFLANRPNIDFIVLTKGIPIRRKEDQQSVDSLLASYGLENRKARMANPYFNMKFGAELTHFSFLQYHFRLVARLDGYTREQCLKLVDNSLAARPVKGPFLLHQGPAHPEIQFVNDALKAADTVLKNKRMESLYDTDDKFPGNYKNLMGYYSWGSNDHHFDKAAYNSLGFAPGAIAETVVSTSGRTFTDPKAPGQSLIADLIAQGVTGCKGYVSEPYADAIAVAPLLFDRYTIGFSLVESFYMASRYLCWKDVVIGDPLCAPYCLQSEKVE